MQNNRTFIIAEIGVNHNGNINLAKKLIVAAKKAGADAVKIQTFFTEKVMSKNSPLANFQKKNLKEKDFFKVAKKLELNEEKHIKLMKFCKKKKIIFFSTPCDLSSAKLLNKLNVELFKTASADIDHYYLHQYLSKQKKPVIISTGMCKEREIRDVLKIYNINEKKNVYLLHCISSYPAKHKDLNFNFFKKLKKFKFPIGFSDHTKGYMASCIAVAMGAKVIEKHFTIDNDLPGLDHKISSNPKNFYQMVKQIRKVEQILGKGKKEILPSENNMHKISKKSLHYKKSFKKGYKLNENDFEFIRPGNGISAMKLNNVINKRLKKNVKRGMIVKFNDLSL